MNDRDVSKLWVGRRSCLRHVELNKEMLQFLWSRKGNVERAPSYLFYQGF